MKAESREMLLWAAAVVLGIAVGLFAMLSAPDFAPVKVTPGSETTSASVSASSLDETASSSPPARFIRLNSASREELMTLEGIGETLADRILAYREAHGGFDSLEELMEVDGIGEKRFAAWCWTEEGGSAALRPLVKFWGAPLFPAFGGGRIPFERRFCLDGECRPPAGRLPARFFSVYYDPAGMSNAGALRPEAE